MPFGSNNFLFMGGGTVGGHSKHCNAFGGREENVFKEKNSPFSLVTV